MAYTNSINMTTDPVGIMMRGLTWNPPGYNVSGLGLNTFGFVFLVGDIWLPVDNIQNVIWSGCTNCTVCF